MGFQEDANLIRHLRAAEGALAFDARVQFFRDVDGEPFKRHNAYLRVGFISPSVPGIHLAAVDPIVGDLTLRLGGNGNFFSRHELLVRRRCYNPRISSISARTSPAAKPLGSVSSTVWPWAALSAKATL